MNSPVRTEAKRLGLKSDYKGERKRGGRRDKGIKDDFNEVYLVSFGWPLLCANFLPSSSLPIMA